jgi:hypothetical protein
MPPKKKEEKETLELNTMLYHEKEEPRVFKAGEEIPEGWGYKNMGWRQDFYLKWIRE